MTARRPRAGNNDRLGADAVTASAITRASAMVHARPILVITDFDGTLSPIVEVPAEARIVPSARRALERLQTAATTLPEGALVIAVLSGRDAGDVARRVGVPGIRYLGQHGIERGSLTSDTGATPVVEVDPAHAGAAPDLLRLAEAVAARIGRPDWLSIEHKGASIGIHYRRADDPDGARRSIHEGLDAAAKELGLGPVDRLESRRVVELRPAGASGKGEATLRLIDEVRPASVLITGDDRTDVDGFLVVRRRRETTSMQALVVGVSGAAETPPTLLGTVDVMLPSPEAAAAVLEALAAAVEADCAG